MAGQSRGDGPDEPARTVNDDTQLVAEIGRDLRAPLLELLGTSELLLDSQIPASERLSAALTVRRHVEQLLAVVDDALDLAAIEAGRMEIESAAFSPHDLIAEVVERIRPKIAEKGLAFDVRYVTSVPREARGDARRVRQVLLNLLSIAVKLTARGAVALDVSVDAGPSAWLTVDVRDTGSSLGGGEGRRARPAAPPLRAPDSSPSPADAARLGLRTSRRLAELLGGGVETEGAPGLGRRFRIWLPLGDVTGAPTTKEAPPPVSPRRMPMPDPARLHGRVLVVEDGPDNQLLVGALLRRWGLEVELVSDGGMAVQRTLGAWRTGRPFDLVLMDIQMPQLDGYAATGRLREAGYRRPIVALTAHALPGERERCLAAGCDDHLVKPIDREAFTTVVARFLAARSDGAAGAARPRAAASAGPRAPSPPPVTERGGVAPRAPSPPPVTERAGAAPRAPSPPPEVDPDLREAIAGFIARLPVRLGDLRQALALGDWRRGEELAHQLKGAGGSYGFPEISAAAAELERAFVAGEPIERAVGALEGACARARPPG